MVKKSPVKKNNSAVKERAQRVAYNLKRLRAGRGIKTVNELIDLMNQQDIEINHSYMRRLESAHAPFGLDMEQRFVQFYRVDISEFYRPISATEKDREIDFIRDSLSRLEIDKIRRIKDLIPVLFGGFDVDERRKGDSIPGEEKSA